MFDLLRRYRELLAVAVLLVVPLLLYLAGSKAPGRRNAVDRAVLTVAAPLEKAVVWTVEKGQDVWYGYVYLVGLGDENLALRRENIRLRGEVARTEELTRENERLRELVEFAPAEDRRAVAAPVIAVGANPALARTLRVGKGTADGIVPGLSVVTPEGVVGSVVASGPGWGDVLLLADPQSAVAAVVARSRARVTVRGLGTLDSARLENALRTDDIEEGDLLVTSGTGGVFPKGLPVGRVSGIDRKSHGMFQLAAVVPAVDLSRLEEVVVLVPDEAGLARGAGP